eukprot:8753381-Alexandrium_andersonii.AAC.1
MKLPKVLITKEVMRNWMTKRSAQAGKRLASFVSRGGIGADGAIAWSKAGSYQLTFTEGKLSKVQHWGGDEVSISSDYGVTQEWSSVGNFDDFGSHLTFGCFPPCCLSSFFVATKTGPMALTNFSGKPKVLQAECESVYAEWEEGKLKGEVGLNPTEQ